MKVPITDSLKKKIFVALLAAGVSAPSAYIAVDHTVPSEGFYTSVYVDPVGLKTYCVGHMVRKTETLKASYTEAECINLFVKDWKEHEAQLNKVVKVPYRSEWMKGSGTDFTFHMGINSVASSTYLRNLNNKRYDLACEQLTRWVYGKVNGVSVKMPGLVTRATARYKYCMGEVPTSYKPTLERWGVKSE